MKIGQSRTGITGCTGAPGHQRQREHRGGQQRLNEQDGEQPRSRRRPTRDRQVAPEPECDDQDDSEHGEGRQAHGGHEEPNGDGVTEDGHRAEAVDHQRREAHPGSHR